MKVNINCQKCNSPDIKIIAEEGNPLPMYRCNRCGHKSTLFPQFGKNEKAKEEKIEKETEDLEEEFEGDEGEEMKE